MNDTIITQSAEEWRDIVGYVGLYQVSSLGRVRRIVPMRRGVCPAFGLLKPAIGTSGYRTIVLCYPKAKKGTPKTIHRLMAYAFLGEPPSPEYQCNHKNGDKTDNRIENLEWMSPLQNTWHAINTLGKLQSGENNPGSKLTEEQVKDIRRLYAGGGYTHKSLAPLFGVTQQTITRVIKRQLWAHVE